MATVSVSDAKDRLAELLDLVATGEEVTIMRHGRPPAVIVAPGALRSWRADVVLAEAESIRVMLDDAASGGLDGADRGRQCRRTCQ